MGSLCDHRSFSEATYGFTSCFDDVILIPVGSWAFLAFAIILTGVMWKRRERVALPPDACEMGCISGSSAPNSQAKGDVISTQSTKPLWPRTRFALLCLANSMLSALFAMHAVEIARLAKASQGVGLLPFTFVSLTVIIISLWWPAPAWSKGGFHQPARPHGIAWFVGVIGFGVYTMVTYGVKIWTYQTVKNNEDRYNAPIREDEGLDGKYPYDDKLTDFIVIIALYFVFLQAYGHMIFLEYRRVGWKAFA